MWNGEFVEESNLPVHISKLRRSLGESKYNRFVETVQGTGYRFVAPVQTIETAEWQFATTASRMLNQQTRSVSHTVYSIAILPLRNENQDPEVEYLADGLTESLINVLSRVPNLRVIARNTLFRYKDKDPTLRELSIDLGVSYVLSGRVRIIGDDLVVGVELTQVNNGTQIWGDQYLRKFSDILSLQEEISLTIVDKLQLCARTTRRNGSTRLSQNVESYRLYLKGKHFLEKRCSQDIYRAIDYFAKSIELDAENIYSYTEIIEAYRLLHLFDYMAYEEFASATKPILSAFADRDQSSDIVHVMYCDLNIIDWKFDQAAAYCQEALTINPNCAKARVRYSDILLQSRDFARALEQLEIIMTVDPLSEVTYVRTGRLLYLAGQYESALAYLNDALEMEPGTYELLALRGAVHTEMKEYEAAIHDFYESLRTQHHPEILAMTAVAYAKQGNTTEAYKVLDRLIVQTDNKSGRSCRLAQVYLALGKKHDAYAALEEAYINHEPDLRALTYDHRWVSIRGESHFADLIGRVGLPPLQ